MKIISDVKTANICFGKSASAYDQLFSDLGNKIFQEEYTFQDNSVFETDIANSPDVTLAQKIYWIEILMRAHLCSVAAIVRASRWIDASTRELSAGNLFGWASACRSLMEAAGDNMHSLGAVSISLAENCDVIRRALDGRVTNEMHISSELEDILIHFTHARKVIKSENAPDSHSAMQSWQYIRYLNDMNIKGSSELYSEFCGLVHPADKSVSVLFDLRGNILRFDEDIEKEKLLNWAENSKDVLGGTLEAAFNPAILTLKVLQKFGIFKQVKELRHTGLEHLNQWKKIEKHF